eukprot:TRINITY_DN35002_c0_g1_i1.p1 TRINITY_DN35002_c0_g1~~TRINITY_DN35002_c0_g1_i1.p1  ORF type:complete len:111 (-),score=26.70 TRINITY_DN35002_c0_g1_i1:186-485(-)
MAGGADAAYINEEKFGIKELTSDLEILASKMDKGQVFRGLLLINEKANPNYNIDFLRRMYTEEGKDRFTVRTMCWDIHNKVVPHHHLIEMWRQKWHPRQ